MNRYSLSHLSDGALLRGLLTFVAREREALADLLAHIAEVSTRKLFLPAGYSSMISYCIGELHLSEDAAYKRIQAARSARRFPAIFEAIAEGRLHLAGVCLLSPHLCEDTAAELLAAAVHKTKSEIELLLAERFPRPDLPTRVRAIPCSNGSDGELASGQVEAPEETQLAPGQVDGRASVLVQTPAAPGWPDDRPRVKPLAPQRYSIQFTMSKSQHDMLRYAQDLLSHEIPSGDLAEVIGRAIAAFIPQLEKRKFAATEKPRRRNRRAARSLRHIPAHVKRAVWKRDGGQCTFVSEDGHRCTERKFVEFDHVLEVARGGEATLESIRLRCRGHNQLEAERTFGVEFMRHKRIAAAEARAARSVDSPGSSR